MEKRFSYQTATRNAVSGLLIGLVILGVVGYLWISEWTFRVAGIVLTREQSAIFFGLFAVLALAILIGSGLGVAAGRREIVISPAGLRLPKGELTRAMIEVDARAVRDLRLQQAGGVATLQVKHASGSVKLRSSNLASADEFEDLVHAISSVTGLVPR